jgi:hypothetical protein
MPAPGDAGRLACTLLLCALVPLVSSISYSDIDSPIRAIGDVETASQLVQAAALAPPVSIDGYRRRSRLQIPPRDIPAGTYSRIDVICLGMGLPFRYLQLSSELTVSAQCSAGYAKHAISPSTLSTHKHDQTKAAAASFNPTHPLSFQS